jgi:hypothetical protein
MLDSLTDLTDLTDLSTHLLLRAVRYYLVIPYVLCFMLVLIKASF